jgi:hypothetical protein
MFVEDFGVLERTRSRRAYSPLLLLYEIGGNYYANYFLQLSG